MFMKIGIGAHLYEQPPRDLGKNAVHHLGMQVVSIAELYDRITAAGLHIPNPIRQPGGGEGYLMLGAPDNVVIEVFEPGRARRQRPCVVRAATSRGLRPPTRVEISLHPPPTASRPDDAPNRRGASSGPSRLGTAVCPRTCERPRSSPT